MGRSPERRVELEDYQHAAFMSFAEDEDALTDVMSIMSINSIESTIADTRSAITHEINAPSHYQQRLYTAPTRFSSTRARAGVTKTWHPVGTKKGVDKLTTATTATPETSCTTMPRRARIALGVGLGLMAGAAIMQFHRWKPSHVRDDDWVDGGTLAPVALSPTPRPTSLYGREPARTQAPTQEDILHVKDTLSPTDAPLPVRLNPIDTYGSLYVEGSHLYSNKTLAPVQLTGFSLFWSNTGWNGAKYYNRAVVETLVNDWNCSIVRCAMGVEDEGGYVHDPSSNIDRVKAVVDAAIEFGIYVIIDFHSHYAEQYNTEARNFFAEMAQLYGSAPNVVFEIYNEPIRSSWLNDVRLFRVKPYAESILDVIRRSSPNLVVVGSPEWSQKVDEAAADPIVAFENVAYTLHFYAATQTQWLRDRADAAIQAGICIFVTEWGTVSADGDGLIDAPSVSDWIEFLDKHMISHANWAMNDKAESASALLPGASSTGNWDRSNYSPSGRLVRSILRDAAERQARLYVEWSAGEWPTKVPTVQGFLPPNTPPTTLGEMSSIEPTSRLEEATPSNMSIAARVVDIHGMLKVENESRHVIGELSHAQFQLRGISLHRTNSGFSGEKFYNGGVVNTIIDDWHSNVIRAAVGVELAGGYLEDPVSNEARLRVIIDSAIARGIYVIIAWHTHRAEEYRLEAELFFDSIASEYGAYPNVIFETGVPAGLNWTADAKPYAEAVIAVVRRYSSNLVLVGTPNNSQDVDIAALDPVTRYENIAYALKFFAATHSRNLRDKAFKALSRNVAIVASEYGTADPLGRGDVDVESTLEWIVFLAQHGIGHCNWCVKDKPSLIKCRRGPAGRSMTTTRVYRRWFRVVTRMEVGPKLTSQHRAGSLGSF